MAWLTDWWKCGLANGLVEVWPGKQTGGSVAWLTDWWKCGLANRLVEVWPG